MKKFFRKLKRIGIVSVLVSILSVQTALAAYVENSKTLQPATYLFGLALSANGVAMTCPLDHWFSAYELYLNKTGDSAAISRLNSLKNISWGSSYSQMSQLYSDVHAWLESCSYVTNSSGYRFYSSPIKEPEPLAMSEMSKNVHCNSIQTAPFDVKNYTSNSVVTSGKNEYLFSRMSYSEGSSGTYYFWRHNYFIPKNTDFFGVLTSFYIYTDNCKIVFYQKDSSSAGYSACNVIGIYDWYNPDTLKYVGSCGSLYSNEYPYLLISSKWFPSLPFPVVKSVRLIPDYLAGDKSVLVQDSTTYLQHAGDAYYSLKPKLRDNIYKVKSVGKKVSVPTSAADGEAILSALIGADEKDIRSILSSKAGLTITYEDLILTIKHRFDGRGDPKDIDTLKFSPDAAVINKDDITLYKRYGYDLSDVTYSCSFPLTLTGSQTITVDYVSREYPYTVNYYYDGVLGKSESHSVRSYADTVHSVAPAERSGYRLAADAYSPAFPVTINDSTNQINVYYESWEYPYTVNHYYGSKLQESFTYSVPSYANTVSEVPLIESDFYKLSSSEPYDPELPAVIDDETNVINVQYYTPTAEIVSNSFGGVSGDIKDFVKDSIPYALGTVSISTSGYFLVRFLKKILSKS